MRNAVVAGKVVLVMIAILLRAANPSTSHAAAQGNRALELQTADQAQTQATARSSRTAIELTGNWRFQIDAPDVGEEENWQAANFDRSQWTHVEVPRAWDLFNEAMWNYEGVGWYSTELAAGLTAKGQLQRLKFGRVNYHARVWLNGELLGENLNGYLPFEFDVTGRLRDRKSVV